MTELRDGGLHRLLPARRDAVDEFCRELRSGLLACLPADERFAVELLVREALMNAVVHGARNVETAEIECAVEPIPGGIRIRVADNGEGFDWRTGGEAETMPLRESGMGLPILHRYTSQVRFSGNGNQVELTRMFDGEESHEL